MQPLLLFPALDSHLLKHPSQSAVFFVWTHLQVSGVALWTNLCASRTWHAVPLIAHSSSWFHLSLSLASLPPNQRYEYTLKYYQDGQEKWLGSVGENGAITIVAPPSLPPPPLIASPHVTLQARRRINDQTTRTTFKIDQGNHVIPLAKVSNMHSYMALARKSSSWLVPVSGMARFEKDGRPWYLLIYMDNTGVVWVWWVKSTPFATGWLHVSSSVLELHTQGCHGVELLCGTTTCMDEDRIMTILGNNNIKQEDGVMDTYLGYCTWNALGLDVNVALIDQALASLSDLVGYLIIDDGWQQQHDGYLTDFGADRGRFPLGLAGSLRYLKQHHPSLRSIGVWHALWGSWFGIDPLSLGKLYEPKMAALLDSKKPVGLVNHPAAFYKDFYQALAHSGVDFVKIDNQGAVDDLVMATRHQIWHQYRLAATTAAERSFSAPPLHSMAMIPGFFSCTRGILRNSDDYFPDVLDSHSWHIYGNLMNSVWLSSFGITLDFDMFQTGHPFGEYHAASRAISGGPVYITDKTGAHDCVLLRKLVAESRSGEHHLLRCKQPCRPFCATILGGRPTTWMGAWNTNTSRGRIDGYWSMRPCLATAPLPGGYLAYITLGLDQGTWKYNMDAEATDFAFRLDGCTLIHAVPLFDAGVACLGLLDKLNGTQAIVACTNHTGNRFNVRLSHRSSQCGFIVLGTVLWATLDGVSVNLQQRAGGLWILDMTLAAIDIVDTPYFSIELCWNPCE